MPYPQHVGLNTAAFSKEIEGSEWLPPSKRALVDQLVEAVEEQASAQYSCVSQAAGRPTQRAPGAPRRHQPELLHAVWAWHALPNSITFR